MKVYLYLPYFVLLHSALGQEKPCILKNTKYGTVCVCNSTYCDTIPKLLQLNSDQYQFYSTSKIKLGISTTVGTFKEKSKRVDHEVHIKDLKTRYQTIMGFGGAFTDSTGINILKLSESAQEKLFESYFGKEGSEYSIGRVPIGSTDFSEKGYTYCDKKDTTLKSFALQEADFRYKIPIMKRAMKMRGKENIKFLSAAWTAPTWMKTNDKYYGFGAIKYQYYDLWAKYHIRFFEEYAKNGIKFWGTTPQNEWTDGDIGLKVPNNGFTIDEMVRWIKTLGPAIRNSTFRDLKLLLHDDQIYLLPLVHMYILSDDEVIKYADGIATHWYSDSLTPSEVILYASSDKKHLFRLASEACLGSYSTDSDVEIGSWDRGDTYAKSIIKYLNYDYIGWLDWNMALDLQGGPTWIQNYVDSPILVNAEKDEFYKQPMYYALAHFSKFVTTGSVRIHCENTGQDVESVAFLRPDNKIVVALRNGSNEPKSVRITILKSSTVIEVEANSFNTFLTRM